MIEKKVRPLCKERIPEIRAQDRIAYFNVRIMKVCAYIFQDAGTVVPAPKRAPHPSVGVGVADTTIGRSTLCKRWVTYERTEHIYVCVHVCVCRV